MANIHTHKYQNQQQHKQHSADAAAAAVTAKTMKLSADILTIYLLLEWNNSTVSIAGAGIGLHQRYHFTQRLQPDFFHLNFFVAPFHNLHNIFAPLGTTCSLLFVKYVPIASNNQ